MQNLQAVKMNVNFSDTEFYRELESGLPASTGEIRKKWVTAILEKNIDIKDLSLLLTCEPKVASRFLWLLSEIGISDPKRLFIELPFLLDLFDQHYPIYKISLASFWRIAGVPPENEGRAIDLLFQWLLSPDINVTLKSRSLMVLFKLTKKYPELKNELSLCLKDQMDKHTKEFEKRAVKILREIEPGQAEHR